MVGKADGNDESNDNEDNHQHYFRIFKFEELQSDNTMPSPRSNLSGQKETIQLRDWRILSGLKTRRSDRMNLTVVRCYLCYLST